MTGFYFLGLFDCSVPVVVQHEMAWGVIRWAVLPCGASLPRHWALRIKCFVVAVPRWTLWGSPGVCNCTSTTAFHRVRNMTACVTGFCCCYWFTPPHAVFGEFISLWGMSMLLCKKLIMAGESHHLTRSFVRSSRSGKDHSSHHGVAGASLIITMQTCKAPIPRLKALNKHPLYSDFDSSRMEGSGRLPGTGSLRQQSNGRKWKTAILRSPADSLRSHVILHRWVEALWRCCDTHMYIIVFDWHYIILHTVMFSFW